MSYDYEKQKMVEEIYDKIADKKLTFGCQVAYRQYAPFWIYHCWGTYVQSGLIYDGGDTLKKHSIGWVIGHSVYFGVILRYLKNNFSKSFDKKMNKLLHLWQDLDYPIEKQTKQCVKYVHSLLPKETEKIA